MNWIAFCITAAVTIVLQTTLMGFLELRYIRPDLVALVAVFYVLHARRGDALLVGWMLGFLVDLCGLSFSVRANVGVGALTYGVATLITLGLRELTFRDHLLSFIVFSLLWTFLTHVLIGGAVAWFAENGPRLREVVAVALYTAAYTAAVGPYALWVLRRVRNALGLGLVRTYRVRG
ncbi:MAG: rod shape-determining protein MreD [Phycisphaerae bacterium]|nr:rod shape-determining protein MreD [Phycisphaerae bacterium]